MATHNFNSSKAIYSKLTLNFVEIINVRSSIETGDTSLKHRNRGIKVLALRCCLCVFVQNKDTSVKLTRTQLSIQTMRDLSRHINYT